MASASRRSIRTGYSIFSNGCKPEVLILETEWVCHYARELSKTTAVSLQLQVSQDRAQHLKYTFLRCKRTVFVDWTFYDLNTRTQWSGEATECKSAVHRPVYWNHCLRRLINRQDSCYIVLGWTLNSAKTKIKPVTKFFNPFICYVLEILSGTSKGHTFFQFKPTCLPVPR